MSQGPIYAPPKESNVLAVVSFVLSMITPIAVVLVVIADVLPGNSVLVDAFALFAVLVVFLGMVGTPVAIILGHIAYVRAKRYPPELARRGLAVTALVVGYMSLVVIAFFVLLFIAFASSIQGQIIPHVLSLGA